MCSLGDVDGDFITDIAVGAETARVGNRLSAGALYVLTLTQHGNVKSAGNLMATGTPELSISAFDYWLFRGRIGDLDDGQPELAVGAKGDSERGARAGAVYILTLAGGTMGLRTRTQAKWLGVAPLMTSWSIPRSTRTRMGTAFQI